jgi:hypothetical protein
MGHHSLNAQQAVGYFTLAAGLHSVSVVAKQASQALSNAKVMQAQGELPLAAREGALGHDFGSLLTGIKEGVAHEHSEVYTEFHPGGAVL